MHRQVTLKDLAKELDISASTVSRALANSPLVKAKTRKAVQDLARKYNYQPNFTALSLRNAKTRTIGIIIPHLVHEFFALVIRGIEDFAYSNGYSVIICSTHDNYEREVIDANTLLAGRVDGLLACISPNTRQYDHFLAFVKKGLPLVFFDCICDVIDTHKVVIDDERAGYHATEHLVKQGCTTIGYIGGPINLNTNSHRFEGYRKALRDAGLDYHEEFTAHCQTGDFLDGLNAAQGFFEKGQPDALFTATDMLGVGAIKAAKQRNLKIPDDLAIVGFSNWIISSIYEPTLSTVTQPGFEMGFKAAELLIDQINNPDNENFETFELTTDLIVRESSKRT